MLRIALYIATNIAILLIFSIAARIFGLDQWMYQSTGINYTSLLVWCALFGFGGSLVSLMLSKFIAKKSMGVQLIEQPQNQTEQWILDTVRRHADAAGIGMPEVGVFPDPSANAFATGASKNSALVAVSYGLVERFDREAVEAVIGHEIAHIANGDMVTMSLLQGVLNTFVLFFARIVGHVVDRAIFKTENGMGAFLVSLVAQVIFGILASVIVNWFSRYREFRADEGGAQLAGKQNMILALKSLQREHAPAHMTEQLAAFGIQSSDVKALFSTHPPLEERIRNLEKLSS